MKATMTDLINTLIDVKMDSIHTTLACKIMDVDKDNVSCSVQPLQHSTMGLPMPMIHDILIDSTIGKTYTIQKKRNVGDLVFVSFTGFSFEQILYDHTQSHGEPVATKFAPNGGFIAGDYQMIKDKPSPIGHYDLVITHNSGTKIGIDSSGKVEIITDNLVLKGKKTTIEGDLTVTGATTMSKTLSVKGAMEAKTTLKIKGKAYATHTHSNGNNGSPTGVPV